MTTMFLNSALIHVENILSESEHLDHIDSDEIDKLIIDLQRIKDKFKKGSGKNYYRKEKAKIQGAISSLRFIKKKAERRKEKLLDSKQ
tara:strand:- start:61 stop:324 length:264 start_codon:yes stop_codon:yes gene_type:complete